ncbi:methyltransferase domain-containing protein [Pedobacter aquae]|uniref:Methyltransferase domain-containing protein n=1 Tax=Pedobacter aquae TaxID=2605747 RepID=A0A5C0VL15_9SPHI|nr:methyltransferase domain-containing protein [Pedobacter aquae]QEK52839.1 methyltransferase domain-containing protein [Pedobacter aquae]
MPSFNHRSTALEIMDDFSLDQQAIHPVLKELEVINQLLGGFQVFYNAFKKLPIRNKDIICDWGCGGGDSLKVLKKYFHKRKIYPHFIGIDATPSAISFAKAHHETADIHFRLADVLEEPFLSEEFDYVISSLFTHHFNNDEWKQLVARMLYTSKKAVIINDLHRHWFAYYSIGWLTQLFSKSPMVKHDSKLSVLRSFTRKELQTLLAQMGIKKYSIKWMWAFRWQIIIYK